MPPEIITCKAAVAWKPGESLSIEEIQVAPPKAGEVRIKILHTALCHTDLYTLSGKDPEGIFPSILGHEATGIVESVGQGVESVRAGDYVIPCFIPQCRECEYCVRDDTNLCQKIRVQQGQGKMPDGTSRFSCRGQSLAHFMGCSTFTEYTVCAEISVTRIDSTASMDKVCLLGCGVSTGYGAVLNTCKMKAGSTVAVWGLGAVGLAVIMGAKKAGAKQIVGIDMMPEKFAKAKQLGATETLNPAELPAGKQIQAFLIENFNGGFDYTFECVGNVHTMRQALEAAHKGWGMSCVIGVAGAGEEISTRPFQLITGRRWVGSSFGGWKSRDAIPKLIQSAQSGDIDLDSLVTQHYCFDEINKAFDHMKKGEGLRTVITVASK